jgi:hypothetical protein
LKLRFSQNPKRQRGKNDVDFASLTRRVMKKTNASRKSSTSKLKRWLTTGRLKRVLHQRKNPG